MSTINRISFKRGGEWNGYGRGERSTAIEKLIPVNIDINTVLFFYKHSMF